MAPQFCWVCKKIFARSDSLKLHLKRKHQEEFKNLPQKISDNKCLVCNKYFTKKYTLKRHIKQKHADSQYSETRPEVEVTYNYQCSHCNRKYSYKHHLKSHIKNLHSSASTVPTEVLTLPGKNIKHKICPLCKTYSSPSLEEFVKHIRNLHDVKVESEELQFLSVSEFLDWKKNIEKNKSTQFRKETTKSSKHHDTRKHGMSDSRTHFSQLRARTSSALQADTDGRYDT